MSHIDWRKPTMFTNAMRLLLKNAESRPDFNRILRHFREACEFYYSQFWGMARGPFRAASIHAAIDKTLELDPAMKRGDPVTCKTGCSACCHIRVGITPDEAELLALTVPEIGIDMALLERQAAFQGDEIDWLRLPKAERACVFLDAEGRCKVYPARPSACRKYFVVSDPELCGVSNEAEVGRIVMVKASFDAEVMATAQLQLAGERVKPLPELLKATLDAKCPSP